MDAVLTTIVDGRQAICKITPVAVETKLITRYFIHSYKFRHSALSLLLPKRLPVLNRVDPLNLFCLRGKWPTMVMIFVG
jgi:hypothetical protein